VANGLPADDRCLDGHWRSRNGFAVARQSPDMLPSQVAVPRAARSTVPPVPLVSDVDPVLVGIIAVLLLIVFMFFLLLRRTVKSFAEGMREGRKR
jgi:hypothetical protein